MKGWGVSMGDCPSGVKISFIIPALNEEKHIGSTIESIHECIKGKFTYQIIVSDNGSSDSTIAIAEEKGAIIIHLPGVKISTLRNEGVKVSQGDILIFIDADVWLHDSWGKYIKQAIESLEKDPDMITGSIYDIPENGSWIEKYWFGPSAKRHDVNYINGGHIIVTRKTFDKIGGFKEDLETGEDYEFCQRGKKKGIKVINNPLLKVIHEGYPKDIKGFYRRERWHGKGDYASIELIIRSKPALLSLGNLIVLCASVISAFCIRPWLFLLYAVYIVGVSSLSGFHRTRKMGKSFIAAFFLYIVYFWARSITFLDLIIEATSNRYMQKNS